MTEHLYRRHYGRHPRLSVQAFVRAHSSGTKLYICSRDTALLSATASPDDLLGGVVPVAQSRRLGRMGSPTLVERLGSVALTIARTVACCVAAQYLGRSARSVGTTNNSQVALAHAHIYRAHVPGHISLFPALSLCRRLLSSWVSFRCFWRPTRTASYPQALLYGDLVLLITTTLRQR